MAAECSDNLFTQCDVFRACDFFNAPFDSCTLGAQFPSLTEQQNTCEYLEERFGKWISCLEDCATDEQADSYEAICANTTVQFYNRPDFMEECGDDFRVRCALDVNPFPWGMLIGGLLGGLFFSYFGFRIYSGIAETHDATHKEDRPGPTTGVVYALYEEEDVNPAYAVDVGAADVGIAVALEEEPAI